MTNLTHVHMNEIDIIKSSPKLNSVLKMCLLRHRSVIT